MSLRAKTLSGLKLNVASTIVSFLFQTGQLVILSRLFAPEIFGLMSLLMIVTNFSTIFLDLGVSNAIIQRKETDIKELSTLYYLNIFMGAILCVAIFLCSGMLAELFRQPRLQTYLQWVSLIYLIIPFGQQYRAIFQKRMAFNIIVKIDIFTTIVSTVFTIVLAYTGFGIYSIIWGQIANAAIGTLLVMYFGRKEYKPIWYFNFQKAKPYLGFGLYQSGESIMNYFNTNIDGMSIGRLVGPTMLGYYQVAYNIIIIPSRRINPILTKVFFPAFSIIQDDQKKLKKNFYKLLNILNFVNFPIFFALFVLAEPFIIVVFGAKWLTSVPILRVLCGVGLLRSLGNPVGSLMYAKGEARRIFLFNVYKVFLQVPGIIAGAYIGGAMGVAIAFLCLQVFFSSFNYTFLIRRAVGESLGEYLNVFKEPLIWSVAMALVIYAVKYLLRDYPHMVVLLVSLAFGLITYGLFFISNKKETPLELKQILLSSIYKKYRKA
ncbi:MAG: MOP flippase family protein [Chitinophagaceae bacterium]|nr:MOP flippase family protein [Chitinophagaceae bacterium]